MSAWPTVVNIFGASSGQFRRPAPAGRWHVATGVSPWEREVESPPAPSGAADGRDRSMGHTYRAMQFGYVRRISVAPPGLVCFPCLWSTGSRPWLPAQVPTGPRHDRRVGSGRITKHGIHRHPGLSKDVYSSDAWPHPPREHGAVGLWDATGWSSHVCTERE